MKKTFILISLFLSLMFLSSCGTTENIKEKIYFNDILGFYQFVANPGRPDNFYNDKEIILNVDEFSLDFNSNITIGGVFCYYDYQSARVIDGLTESNSSMIILTLSYVHTIIITIYFDSIEDATNYIPEHQLNLSLVFEYSYISTRSTFYLSAKIL